MMAVFVDGVDMSENGQALDAVRAERTGTHYLGSAHTLANFETAFYARVPTTTASSSGRRKARSTRAAGQPHLEEDARPSTRPRPIDPGARRGAARLHHPAQGIDATRRSKETGARPTPLRADPVAAALAASSTPDLRARPVEERLVDQAAFLPTGATVSVTASPAKGIEATVALRTAPGPRLRVHPHLLRPE